MRLDFVEWRKNLEKKESVNKQEKHDIYTKVLANKE